MDDTTKGLLEKLITALAKAAAGQKSWARVLLLFVLTLVVGVAGAWLTYKMNRQAELTHRQHLDEMRRKLAAKEHQLDKNNNEIKEIERRIKSRREKIVALNREITRLDAAVKEHRPDWL